MVSCTQLSKLCNTFLPKIFFCAKKISALRAFQRALQRDCAPQNRNLRARAVDQ
jgi:hypothetical protein